MQKAKWLSKEALQIAEKRREVKGKREKERYSYLNAEFQRTAERDKKAFLSDQCRKKKGEINRMGKTRDCFKNIRDARGTLHIKMGTVKDRQFRYDLNQIPYDYTVQVRNRFKGLDLIECLMNYRWRFVTLYRRQGSRSSPRKRNAKKQNGCLRRLYE